MAPAPPAAALVAEGAEAGRRAISPARDPAGDEKDGPASPPSPSPRNSWRAFRVGGVPGQVQWCVDAGRAAELADACVDAAAHSLRWNGWCVISGSCAPDGLLTRCAAAAAELLAARLRTFRAAAGDDPHFCRFQLREVAHRTFGRFDVRVDAGAGGAPDASGGAPRCWDELWRRAAAWADPVLEEAELGGVRLIAGCIVSEPGSEDQHWHRDGPDSADHVNIAVPLVDVTERNGPTEFRLPDGSSIAPACPRGSVLLWRYDCLHRGRANAATAPRPLAYWVRALRPHPGHADGVNFGATPVAAAADAGPYDRYHNC